MPRIRSSAERPCSHSRKGGQAGRSGFWRTGRKPASPCRLEARSGPACGRGAQTCLNATWACSGPDMAGRSQGEPGGPAPWQRTRWAHIAHWADGWLPGLGGHGQRPSLTRHAPPDRPARDEASVPAGIQALVGAPDGGCPMVKGDVARSHAALAFPPDGPAVVGAVAWRHRTISSPPHGHGGHGMTGWPASSWMGRPAHGAATGPRCLGQGR